MAMGSGEGCCEGLGDGGVSELKAGGDELGGVDTGAREEGFIRHFAEGEAEGEGRRGEDGGAMDRVGQGAGELGVGNRAGSGEVDWAFNGWGIEQKEDCGDGVGEADPAHPLAAGTERAAEAEAEEGKHFPKCTLAGTNDDAKTEIDDADTGLDGWLGSGFPLPADVGQEA